MCISADIPTVRYEVYYFFEYLKFRLLVYGIPALSSVPQSTSLFRIPALSIYPAIYPAVYPVDRSCSAFHVVLHSQYVPTSVIPAVDFTAVSRATISKKMSSSVHNHRV